MSFNKVKVGFKRLALPSLASIATSKPYSKAFSGKAKRLKPTLTLLNDNDFVEVPLEPASYTIDGITRIRGRFMMPTGFKPLQVKLSLNAGGQELEQLYDWKLGDKVDSMPLSLLDLPEVDESPIEP